MKKELNKSVKTIISAYCDAFQKYFTFSGRASRYDFWAFRLFDTLVIFLLAVLTFLFTPLVVLIYVYNVATIIPSLALLSRRLHDRGKSFWLWGAAILLAFFGLISNGINSYNSVKMGAGTIIFIIAMLFVLILSLYIFVQTCLQGNGKDNKYGAPVEENSEYVSRGRWFMITYLVIFVISAILSKGFS